ncbi:MAG: phosphoribosylamine--glycine ligase [Campylobacterales bacterium]
MRVIILGSGAREYAIGHKIKSQDSSDEIFFIPGNGATSDIGINKNIKDYKEIADFAKKNSVELIIIGPEQPLVEGATDILKEAGLNVFGPSYEASRLEGSKAFMKEFASRHNILSAKYLETTSLQEAKKYASSLSLPVVVKADGLCAGKGVIIAKSYEEAYESIESMLSGEAFKDAGKKVVIEEYLDGYELSVFAISDGESYKILPACQDHKRLLDGDEGPNTGGMGAYSPTPLCDEAMLRKIEDEIVKKAIDGAKKDGMPYEGVLFCGIMVVDSTPYLLEFNVRFGDPECEVLMPLLKSSAKELFYKAATKELKSLNIEFEDKFGVCVVASSKNYPYRSSLPAKIVFKECDDEIKKSSEIYYAGVSKKEDGLYATGGRVLCSVGFGKELSEAKANAHKRLQSIEFDGMHYRCDIANRAL